MSAEKKQAVPGRRVSLGMAYVIGSLLLCLGAASAAWFLSKDVPTALSDLDPAPVPVTAPAQQVESAYAMDASLQLVFGASDPVIAPAQTGTVTAVMAQPGQALSAGSTVYSIDDVPVIAYAGEGTIYQEMSKGSEGGDVAAAQFALSAALPQWAVVPDGEFGDGTELLVKAWEEAIGVEEPTGTISPAWFVRLPAEPYPVESVKIQVGQPVPAAGETLFSGKPHLTTATLSVPSESGAPLGRYLFVVEGTEISLVHDDQGWHVENLSDAATLMPVVPEELTGTVEGNLHLAQPDSGIGVPASSIFGSSGATCVAVATGGEDSFTIRTVEVDEALVDGTTLVQGDISEGAQVLLNPMEILDETPCP